MNQITKNDHLVLAGAKVFQKNGWLDQADILVRNGKIDAITPAQNPQDHGQNAQVIDAGGLMALPGIIDLHGDGFEYQMAPRAGVHCPLDMAVMANDAALVSAGITTFFYSITDGFEPGLRSRQTVRDLLNVVDQYRTKMRADIRIHIRHEQANTEDHAELLDWIRSGRIDLLSLNNHLPPEGNDKAFARYVAGFKRRVSPDEAVATKMVQEFQTRLPLGATQTREIAALCRELGVSLASHDDMTDADVDHSLGLGVGIAEFPMSINLAHRFMDQGVKVLMGSPNAVRGSSHVASVGARDAVVAGAVDILCSDYHYPSLFRAPFLLAELGLADFHDAWKLVSENPAHAAGLGDQKGALEPGMDADILLLSGFSGLSHDLKSVLVGGKLVQHSSQTW